MSGLPSNIGDHSHASRRTGRPAADALGVELDSTDFASDAQMTVGVRAALLERKLVLVRNVSLDAGSLQAFASGFGDPVEYPFSPGTSTCCPPLRIRPPSSLARSI